MRARSSFKIEVGAEQRNRSTPIASELTQDFAQRRAFIFGAHRARLLKGRDDAVDQFVNLAIVTRPFDQEPVAASFRPRMPKSCWA